MTAGQRVLNAVGSIAAGWRNTSPLVDPEQRTHSRRRGFITSRPPEPSLNSPPSTSSLLPPSSRPPPLPRPPTLPLSSSQFHSHLSLTECHSAVSSGDHRRQILQQAGDASVWQEKNPLLFEFLTQRKATTVSAIKIATVLNV